MIRFSNRDRQTSFFQSSCVSVMTQRSEINEVFRGNQLQKIISILSNTLLPKRVSFASFWLCFISYRKDMLKHYSPNNLRAIVLSFHLWLQGKQGSITQLKKYNISFSPNWCILFFMVLVMRNFKGFSILYDDAMTLMLFKPEPDHFNEQWDESIACGWVLNVK